MPASRPALRQPREHCLHGSAAALQEVGQLVDGDDQRRLADLLAVAALHLDHEPAQPLDGRFGRTDDAPQRVRQRRQRPKTAAFGIDQHELHLALPVIHRQRCQQGAGQGGFSGSRGADNQHVRDVGRRKPQEERRTGLLQAQHGRNTGHLVELFTKRQEPHRVRLAARHFHLDRAAFPKDARLPLVEREGNLVGQARHLRDLCAHIGHDLKAHEARCDGSPAYAPRHLVLGQHRLYLVCLHLQCSSSVCHDRTACYVVAAVRNGLFCWGRRLFSSS